MKNKSRGTQVLNIDELTIGQAKELGNLIAGKKKSKQPDISGEPRIVVLQRGWVVVGNYFRSGTECWLTNAFVIRRWGTTEGLGELAIKGPLSETKLEPSGVCKFHRSAEVVTLDCSPEKWQILCGK